ncbi:MAG: UDP-3-O-acyl-N-acetylglucosamine deacetylase [Desulfovibrionaceae bacterium]|nr:UDP-3-O-acyl-N-acetylglucosamine deacetylase [Desulfovibrionaceae bacterium]
MNQTTIRRVVFCSGIGLHSGREVSMTLNPSRADQGITFVINHADGKQSYLRPSPEAVIATELATTLGNQEASVSTVEHLLAAVLGMGIDNLIITVNGGEIPILDGSASEFLRLFQEAGLYTLHTPRKILRVTREFEFSDGIRRVRSLPYNGLKIDYAIDFPHPAIGHQSFSLDITPATFASIAPARTFGFLKQVEWLRSKGLALGGSLDNAIVLDDTAVLNAEGLRFRDEFVRHKMLDFVGDIAMLGTPVRGYFEVSCSGHEFNNRLLRMMMAEQILELTDEDSLENENKDGTVVMPCRSAREERVSA